MSEKNINLWKVEIFLCENLKQIPIGDGKFKVEANCSIADFINRLEEYVNT